MIKTGCFISLVVFSTTAFAKIPQVEVLVARSQRDVQIEAINLKKELPHKNIVKQYKGLSKIKFNCRTAKKHKFQKPTLLAALSTPSGVIKWNKKKYGGTFKLTSSESKAGCDLINVVSMETYLASLVAKEMNPKWPKEALKAQAVAARSFALFRMKNTDIFNKDGLYHLESSEKDQVSGSMSDVTFKTKNVVQATSGEVLTDRSGKLIEAFFHSKCGGRTLVPEDVWSGFSKGYVSVTCPYCHKHGLKDWKKKIKRQYFSQALDKILKKHYSSNDFSKVPAFALRSDHPSRTNLSMEIVSGKKMIKKSWLRSHFGRKSFPSNHFQVKERGNNLEVSGSGYGHGVGLCQYGAYEMARRGMTYRQILNYYFPNFKIKKIY